VLANEIGAPWELVCSYILQRDMSLEVLIDRPQLPSIAGLIVLLSLYLKLQR